MGFIGDAVGSIAGGIGGGIADSANMDNKFKAQGVNPAQFAANYVQTQTGLDQQNAFLQALQAQNGIANQSSVFNQLQGVANGTGPNPAQAMLDNSTGQNVANQAALMASQRGAGANVGLIARQAALQGGNIQQQAAGQGAALQANQSLGALNQLGGIAGQQVNQQQNAQQNYVSNLLNQQRAYMGDQAQQNQINSGVAAGNTANRNALTNQIIKGAAGAATGIPIGGGDSGGGSVPGASPNVGSLSGNDYSQPASNMFGVDSFSGGAAALAQGGEVHNPNGPRSFAGKHLSGASHPIMMAHGGKVPVILSPGERVIPPQKVEAVAKGKADPIKDSTKVPGKPKVKGNSYANDTFHTNAKEGSIVIPNSVMQSKDPAKEASKFVQAVLAKRK